MKKRPIGRSGIDVGPLGFGGNVFGWTLDEKASFAMLDAFVDAGFDLVDTADVYSHWAPGHSGGESETVLGKWFALGGGRREKVVLATKCGKSMGQGKKGLSARYIEEAVEASLRRLQTDVIDLYQSHDDDSSVPLEETMAAFDRLVKAGKVRAVGASNFSAERFAAALEVSRANGLVRYESLQPLYNLYDRQPFEGEHQALCVREEIGVLPYFALAAGFLTGKYRSAKDLEGQARGGMVQSRLNQRGCLIIEALDEVSEGLGVTPASVAIAWLLKQPSVVAPLASATQPAHFEALARAAELDLDADALHELDVVSLG